MKKQTIPHLLLALLVLPTLLLTACFPTPETPEEDRQPTATYQMTATIESLSDPFSVNVTDSVYAEGIYWLVTDENTAYLAPDGAPIDRADLAVGDTVLITYNGQVMLSYPPQVFALSVQKK